MGRVRSGFGAALYIGRMRQGGFETKFPDRLTRDEARRLLDLPRLAAAKGQQLQLLTELADKSHPNHRMWSAYRDVVRYFAEEHAQGADGEPAAWPERAPLGDCTPDRPFGNLTASEASELMEWGRDASPEYQHAIEDRAHPLHKAVLNRTDHLLQITDGSENMAAEQPSAKASADTAAADAEIAAARADPAYLDKSHPDHAKVMERIGAAYRAKHPEPKEAAAPAASPGAAVKTSTEKTPQQRISEIRGDPAYHDKSAPTHAALVTEMTGAYEAAYPEPAAAESV